MANTILVNVNPTVFQALPDGSALQAVVAIQNAGAIVDQFKVEISDLPPEWYTVPSASVALFPQDRESVRIQIHPPKGKARAGVYPFTIAVVSKADPTQATRVTATLTVPVTSAFEAELAPRKVIGRKARYRIAIRNAGNADIDVEFEASDSAEECDYAFRPEEQHLEIGERATVQLRVKAHRSNFVGYQKQFDFQVRAKPVNAPPKMLQGQFVHKPRLRTWRPIRRLIILLILIGVAIWAYNALGGSSGVRAKVKQFQEGPICFRFNMFCPSPTASPLPTTTGVPTVPPSSTVPPSPTPSSPPTASPQPTTPPQPTTSQQSGQHSGSGTPGGGPGGGGPSTHSQASPTPKAQTVATQPKVASPTVAKPPATATVLPPTWTPLPTSTPAPTSTTAPTFTPVPTATNPPTFTPIPTTAPQVAPTPSAAGTHTTGSVGMLLPIGSSRDRAAPRPLIMMPAWIIRRDGYSCSKCLDWWEVRSADV